MRNQDKYIAVRGYWNTNLGDDLFLKILCETFPNNLFKTQVSEKHNEVFRGIPNLISVKPSKIGKTINKISRFLKIPSLSSEYKLFKKSICGVEIGGSIFMISYEGRGWKYKLSLRNKLNKSVYGKYFIIGSNFGPYNNQREINLYSSFFKETSKVVFRDEYSKNLFPNLPTITSAPDAVLCLNVKDSTYSHNCEYVLISVIDIAQKIRDKDVLDAQKYEKKLIDLCNLIIKNGKKVVLMSFCDDEGDLRVIKRMKNEIDENKKDSVILYSHHDISESLKIINNSFAIVATRFHAMILGWNYRKPTFVISYSKKTENVIADLNPEQSFTTLDDFSEIDFSKTSFNNLFSVINLSKLNQLKISSSNQFKYLRQYIEKINL